nr:EOG090X07IA [Triops cancriformis]
MMGSSVTNKKTREGHIRGETPHTPPINHRYNFSLLIPNSERCIFQGQLQEYRILFVVKSAISHTHRRLAIRNSWGFQDRFSDVPTQRVFLIGNRPWEPELQKQIEGEHRQFGDLVQGDFWDTYFNNTYKTMMGFRWAVQHCPNARFVLFADDDMYISVRNLLLFLRNPWKYPEYLEEEVFASGILNSVPKNLAFLDDEVRLERSLKLISEDKAKKRLRRRTRQSKLSKRLNTTTDLPLSPRRHLQQWDMGGDMDIPEDVRLYSGFVFNSTPLRHRTSKWYIPLSEYPFSLWPPYVTAGAFVLSRNALLDMYYASFYTQHFRFDDIYLAIVAKKAGIVPYHCKEFYYWKKPYALKDYQHVIASHGYEDSEELLRVWNEQKSLGHA